MVKSEMGKARTKKLRMIEPIYYAVLYDIKEPKTVEFAINKRITKKAYENLTDGIEGKEVTIKREDEEPRIYKILSVSTFNILNSVDNHFICVCDCEKLIK